MTELLPYQLSQDVWATEYGIESTPDMNAVFMFYGGAILTNGRKTFSQAAPVSWITYLSWREAKHLLAYRDGEPWSIDDVRGIYCGVVGDEPLDENETYLHRLAAILCDTAEQFRVLHWCVHNLGGQR